MLQTALQNIKENPGLKIMDLQAELQRNKEKGKGRETMSNIVLSSEELELASRQLSGMRMEVQNVFDQIRQKMNMLTSVWESPAASALQNQFQQLSPVMNSYTEQLDRFVLYLSETANAYQENEAALGI